MHSSHSTTTLTDSSSSQSPPQPLRHQALRQQHQQQQQQQPHTLSTSTSNTSLNTAATATPTPVHRPFIGSTFRRNTEAVQDGSKSMFESQGVHPTSTNPLHIHGPWFKDSTGRTVTLRGVNLSGASKMPVGCPSHQLEGFLDSDGTEITFVGRPFPLEDADEHLARLKHWGFNFLRFIVTWEAIEHAGPGKYDYEFFDYLIKVFHKCKKFGFKCFIDPHQDVWSRFTGGSGAPMWTLLLAGLDPNHFAKTNAALVHNTYDDPANFPKMVWATNYNKLAAATMFTLFFAGTTFAPDCVVDQMNIQDYLQTHYIKSYMALAEYITAQDGIEDDVVVGYDTLNEPSAGWIGVNDITKIPHHQELKKDATQTPLQAMVLGQGHAQTVEYWISTFFGPKRKGSVTIDPQGTTAWLTPEKRAEKDERFGWIRSCNYPSAGECIWAAHGVWDKSTKLALDPEYFSKDPDTGETYDFDHRSFLPFCRRFAQAVRTVHKAAVIFLEPPVNEIPPSLPPPHDDDDVAQFDISSRVVYAPHWYDGLTLLNKKWNFFNIDYLGVKRGRYPNYASAIKIGEKAIKECFRYQLACIKDEGQASIGYHPTLIGEIGIPYDMNSGRAYKPGGNYKDQVKAMDANMYALESNHLNFTLWNYAPDNSHMWGDLWNGEDLSLWSGDDRSRDPRRPIRKSSSKSSTDKNSADTFSLHNVGSTASFGDVNIAVQDSPPDTPALTRRSSSSLSQGGQQSPPPVNARVAMLSTTSTSSSSSSSSLKSSSSTASSSRPLISRSEESQKSSNSSNSNNNSNSSNGNSGSSSASGQYLDLGGRALIAFCRPFAQKIAGVPLELSFSLDTVTFKFSFRRTAVSALDHRPSAKVLEPTEIYLPRLHFPSAEDYLASLQGSSNSKMTTSESSPTSSPSSSSSSTSLKPTDPVCQVTVSGGHWQWKENEQILYWWTGHEEQEGDSDEVNGDQQIEPKPIRRRTNSGAPCDEDVFEITVVGKKWTANTPNYRAGGGMSLWNTVSQCCRMS
ncbi:hypothetical protein BG004_004358 [Podila humilis]|nr:hypothetical protein BG004_004358 [Podila humilis]